LPEWAEKAVRVSERADLLLSAADFVTDGAGVLEKPERHRVGPGVVADPMTLLVRTSRQCASLRRAQLIPDEEEGRANGSACEHVENERRGFRLRAVIECQRKIEHRRSLSCSDRIARSYC
jgi:hypothetical protein